MIIQGVLYNTSGGLIQARIIAVASTGPGIASGIVARKSNILLPHIFVFIAMYELSKPMKVAAVAAVAANIMLFRIALAVKASSNRTVR